jgi:flagellar biosynthesis protein FlhF
MSMKRFFGTSSRDAIKQVRAEFGDEAVILSNRAVEGGVEVIASAHGDIAAIIDRTPRPALQSAPATREAKGLPTMARVAQAAQDKFAKSGAQSQPSRPAAETRIHKSGEGPVAESFAHFVQRSEVSRAAPAVPVQSASSSASSASSASTTAQVARRPVAFARETAVKAEPDSRMIAEILHMQSTLQEQMGMLSWRETASRRPLQAKLMSLLLSAGFSPALARAFTDKLPDDYNEKRAALWLSSGLIHNLAAAPAEGDLVDRGGVYALVGPTGVGKTTTAAKLAARCVVKNGAKSLGLITVDNYRIGAEDHLRAYGKILGVTVHTAHDAQSLADMIALMREKHLVLIDTVGMGQRDSRLPAQLQMLNAPSIEPVLFLNASAQGETLDDVVRIYGGEGHRRTSKVIVSKLDEAVKYGFVLDCLIRHKLEVQYVTNGQRVPEDLHPANPQYLVHRALKHDAGQAWALDDADIPLVLFNGSAAAKPLAGTVPRA